MSKIVYLSGPICGVQNYQEMFEKVAEELKQDGYLVINPAALCKVGQKEALSYETFMRIYYILISEADFLMLLPGWSKSRGCNRELGYAQAKGINIVEYSEHGGHFGLFKGCSHDE